MAVTAASTVPVRRLPPHPYGAAMPRVDTAAPPSSRTLLLVAGCAGQSAVREFPVVGATGIGDDYYPGDGNGGYDVDRYDLDVGYDPATDELTGTALITADTTAAPLRGFSLDLVGPDVSSVQVDGTEVSTTRDGDELVVDPGQVWSRAGSPCRSSTPASPEPVRDGPGPRAWCPPTTACWWSASPTSRRPGSRSTTTRATPPPSVSR